jgi:hypothetical protein
MCARNQRMGQRFTRSTITGGRVKSGDRGLASPAKQSPIPCSGSFTEACTVSSEGRAWLGRALLAGLRWRGIGWPRARRPGGFYRSGRGQRRWFGLARRRGARRACSGELRARRTRVRLLLPLFNDRLEHFSVKILAKPLYTISSLHHILPF